MNKSSVLKQQLKRNAIRLIISENAISNASEEEGGRHQGNGGDERVGCAESVEDAVLPPGGVIDLVPPAAEQSGDLYGRQSRHSSPPHSRARIQLE